METRPVSAVGATDLRPGEENLQRALEIPFSRAKSPKIRAIGIEQTSSRRV
jgi:hypothetical protein